MRVRYNRVTVHIYSEVEIRNLYFHPIRGLTEARRFYVYLTFIEIMGENLFHAALQHKKS